MKLTRIVLALLLVASFALAMPLQAQVNDSNITLSNASSINARRNSLINFIWGSAGLPNNTLPVVTTGIVNPTPSLTTNVARVDQLQFNMSNNVFTRAHHYIPTVSNGKVVILHNGHNNCTFDDRTTQNLPFWPAGSGKDGLYYTLESLLAEGHSVLAMFMPRYSPGDCQLSGDQHGMLGALPVTAGSPIKFFVEPVVQAMNYLTTRSPDYKDFAMTGLSGGGWTTTIAAAVDTRIRLSIPVAGSQPLYVNAGGDYEQRLTALYTLVGYPEMYILGAYGKDREQVQVMNRRDSCCFGQVDYLYAQNKPGWNNDVRTYETRVRTALKRASRGAFNVVIDEASTHHTISHHTQINVILAELNGGRRPVGASSTANAFTRGVNGNLHRTTSASQTDTGVPIIGTPAALENAQHTIDVFYRDPNRPGWKSPEWDLGNINLQDLGATNRLRQAHLTGTTWTQTELPGFQVGLISDPVAISTGPNSWDVVATGVEGTDGVYKLFRWFYRGSTVTLETIPTTFRPMGQPVLLSTGTDDYSIFVRNFTNRKVMHISKDGANPWVEEATTSPDIADFPTAIWDGTAAHVYIRALADSRLYEGIKTGATWAWSVISGDTPSVAFQGSPSAVRDTVITTWVRGGDNKVAAYTSGCAPWHYQSGEPTITDSITAVSEGAWARGKDGSLHALVNGDWTKRGVIFD